MKAAVQTVAKVFDCPFCNNISTVECKMMHMRRTATIQCRICGIQHQSEITRVFCACQIEKRNIVNYERNIQKITDLSEPIDVYTDWIDECMRANEVPVEEFERQMDYMDGSMSPLRADRLSRENSSRPLAGKHDDYDEYDDDDEDEDDVFNDDADYYGGRSSSKPKKKKKKEKRKKKHKKSSRDSDEDEDEDDEYEDEY